MAKKTTTKKSAVKKTSKATAAKKRTASTANQTKKTVSAKTKSLKQTKANATQKKSTTNKFQRGGLLANGKKVVHGLRGFHLLSVGVLTALVALVYVVMEPVERSIVAGFTAFDALRGEEVLAPAIRDVVSFDVRHALTALLAVGILYSLYTATWGWKKYHNKVSANSYAGRWIFAGVSGAITIETAALLNGVYDVTTLKLLGFLVVIAAVLAYVAQRLIGVREKIAVVKLAGIAVAVSVLVLAYFIVASVIYGATLDWYHYVVAAIASIALFEYGAVQYLQIKGRKGFLNSEAAEQKYVLTSLIATALFVGVLIVGFAA
ncbi:hypothetical protein BH23PAT2_BH23PAT2_02300 [soil metagenome]